MKNVIRVPDIPNTMTFWHGGDLDAIEDSKAQRSNKTWYGPGLYLITHYGTAKKYAKGNRKLYLVTVQEGVELNSVSIPMGKVLMFIKGYCIGTKQKEVMERISKREKDGKIESSYFINILLDSKAISNNNLINLRKFLVLMGIDYELVSNPFGWHETMMVLYNTKKIVKIQRVLPQDQIEEFDINNVK